MPPLPPLLCLLCLQVRVQLTTTSLAISVDERPILGGPLFRPIKAGDSTWFIQVCGCLWGNAGVGEGRGGAGRGLLLLCMLSLPDLAWYSPQLTINPPSTHPPTHPPTHPQDGVLEMILLKRNRRGAYESGTSNADTFWYALLQNALPQVSAWASGMCTSVCGGEGLGFRVQQALRSNIVFLGINSAPIIMLLRQNSFPTRFFPCSCAVLCCCLVSIPVHVCGTQERLQLDHPPTSYYSSGWEMEEGERLRLRADAQHAKQAHIARLHGVEVGLGGDPSGASASANGGGGGASAAAAAATPAVSVRS
jgi:hypothetical protein